MPESSLSKWKDFLLRTFDIRIGESKRVWFMALNIFLLIQCLWIIKPIVNAQFLSRVGFDQLPLVFLLVALTALLFSRLYSRLLHQLTLESIMTRTYQVSIISLIGFGILIHFDWLSNVLVYVFYIGVALFGLITTSQFWLQANLLFSSLEAKRLFGIIGAGAIAGGISGGYLTSLFTQWIGSRNLLFIAAGLLVISMVICRKIWNEFLPEFHDARQAKKPKSLQEYPLKLIIHSKHLTFLALIIGMSVLVAKLVEFQFSAIASQNIRDPEKLTAYFGFWLSTANAISLAIQLVLTQRLVRFLGVGRSLFLLPGALAISTIAVLRAPVIWTGTLLKVVDVSLKQSINKATNELLILPVPMAIKSQAKTYIDVFVDTAATGIGGLVLIFLINGMNFSFRAVSVLILLLISLWIYFAIRVRHEYVLAFKRQLGIPDEPLTRKERSAASIAEGLIRVLRNGMVDQIIIALNRIEEERDPDLMKEVIPLLSHESARVRAGALSTLYYHKDHTIINLISPLLRDPDEEVRSRAFSCLLAHTRYNRVKFINDYLTDPDPAISGAALVGLATESRGNPKMQMRFDLEQRLTNCLEEARNEEELADAMIVVSRAIGYGRVTSFYSKLMDFMESSDPEVRKKAITAAGNTGDPRFVRTLIDYLMNDELRTAAQKALFRYKPSDILPVLQEISSDPDTPDNLMMQFPALVKHMDSQQAVDFLFGLLVHHQQPALKHEVLEVLHDMKSKFSNLNISGKRIMPYLTAEAEMYKRSLALNFAARHNQNGTNDSIHTSAARRDLLTLLEEQMEGDLRRIFWLLGLTYPPGTILSLYKDLRNQDPDLRISTVELLDNILEPGLKKVVISIVEIAMMENLSDADLERLEIEIMNDVSCYEALLKSKNEKLRHAVTRLIQSLQDPEYGKLLSGE